MTSATKYVLCLTVAGLLLLGAMGGAAPTPNVVINGQPLVSSLTPLTLNGSMLLPMRDVFEALQAEIKWFASERRILAVRGATTISLVLGSRTALVNNTAVQLPVAAQLVGASTYVPLRFPAEAFGGTVRWDNATQTAYIDIPAGTGEVSGTVTEPTPTTPAPTPTTPAPAPAPALAPVRGTVVQTLSTPAPAVLVQLLDSEALRLVQLKPGAVITRGPDGQPAAAATLADFEVGDLAQATLGDDGLATQVALTYAEKAGNVAALAGNTLLFDDGSTLVLGGTVRVQGPNNEAGTLAQLTPGTAVKVRYHPVSKQVWLVKLPAAAAPPTTPTTTTEKVQIFTLGVLNPGRVFKAGDEVQIQLQGTPGALATATISMQVAKGLALAEVQPGIYQGKFVVPAGKTAVGASLAGSLVKGGVKAKIVVSPDPLAFDSEPPAVTAVAPDDNATVLNANPSLEVRYDDGAGSGVDLNTVRLALDGREVTRLCNIDAASIVYVTPGLKAGAHKAQVRLSDLAGNETVRAWNFTVGAPAQSLISSVSHDGQGIMQAGQLVTVSARVADPGGTATFSIGDWKQSLPMTRDGNTQYYRGSYRIQPGDKLSNAPITVQYRTAAGQQAALLASTKLTLDGTLPTALSLTSPADNSTVGDQIQVAGLAPPNNNVRVTITWRAKLLVWTTGQLWQGTVRADAKGKWQTQAVDSDVFLGKASEYTVTAELLKADGTVLATKSVKLVK